MQSFQNPQNSDKAWNKFKTRMLNTSYNACGWTWGGKPSREDVVDCAIKEKRRLWESGRKVKIKKNISNSKKVHKK